MNEGALNFCGGPEDGLVPCQHFPAYIGIFVTISAIAQFWQIPNNSILCVMYISTNLTTVFQFMIAT